MLKQEETNNFSYNWDNDFSVRFKLENGKQLQNIPNNIFTINLPSLNVGDLYQNSGEDEYTATVILRSTKDKRVEDELFSILLGTNFNMEISLSNPNTVDFELCNCSIAKIDYAPLIHHNKSNFFNIILEVKVKKANVFIGQNTFAFKDDSEVNYLDLVDGEHND